MGDEALGGGAELRGVGTHELAADRVFFGGDVHEVMVLAALFDLENKLVEHDLADCIGSTEAACDETHGGIAVAAEGSLHDGEIEREVADLKWF